MPWISDRRWLAVEERLEAIHYELGRIRKQNERMTKMFEDLKADVASLRTVADSAAALIAGLAAKLDEALALGDPEQIKAEIQKVRDELNAEKGELAAAIEQGTRPRPTPQP